MESSQLFGGSDKWSSSESGWTSYILSPTPSDHKSNDGDDDNNNGNVRKYNGHDDSDDSLASDASSGPSHLENAYGNGEKVCVKHDEQESTSKYHSYKKAYKQQKEKKSNEVRRTNVDDGKGVLLATYVPSPVQSENKEERMGGGSGGPFTPYTRRRISSLKEWTQ